MLCEMCGKQTSKGSRVSIEGTILYVCENCSKFGKEVQVQNPVEPEITVTEKVIAQRLDMRTKKYAEKDIYAEDDDSEPELKEDYHKLIFDARNRLGWSQEDLGKKVNERKSIIAKLENKSMQPDANMIKKLERTLNIKLTEKR